MADSPFGCCCPVRIRQACAASINLRVGDEGTSQPGVTSHCTDSFHAVWLVCLVPRLSPLPLFISSLHDITRYLFCVFSPPRSQVRVRRESSDVSASASGYKYGVACDSSSRRLVGPAHLHFSPVPSLPGRELLVERCAGFLPRGFCCCRRQRWCMASPLGQEQVCKLDSIALGAAVSSVN